MTDTRDRPFAGGPAVYVSAQVTAGKSGLAPLAKSDHDGERFRRNHAEILARFADGTEGYIAPMFADIEGIGVDSRYLWVWNKNGNKIACYPHSAVYDCIIGQKSGGSPFAEAAAGATSDKALHKPFVCEDGELLAMRPRPDETYDENAHSLHMFSITPVVEWAKRTVTFPKIKSYDSAANKVESDGWVMIDEEDCWLARKTPLHSWPLLDGLQNVLQA